MEGDLIKINKLLLPLSACYGLGVGVRNWLFDIKVLKSRSFDIPIISLGNITVGGTGKTPHTEYLIRLLSQRYKVAVLSRGYKRQTKGFLLASTETKMQDIGDEPWQVKQKFPDVYVAVDENRPHGIETLLSDPRTKDIEVILLDDAYQHRYVKPGHSILLIDYHRMITDDALLPAGRLREPAKSARRAQTIVVTKCPQQMTPMDYRVVQQALNRRPYQKLYFSTFHYGDLEGLFNGKTRPLRGLEAEEHVLLLTGIASPEQMMMDLRRYTRHITPLSFPDHHFFTEKDAERIDEALRQLSPPRLIITTEKDATRLRQAVGLSERVKQCIYALPIEVEILRGEQAAFDQEIMAFVREATQGKAQP